MKQPIRFGIIGGWLMGRAFASALARWPDLLFCGGAANRLPVEPRLAAVCGELRTLGTARTPAARSRWSGSPPPSPE